METPTPGQASWTARALFSEGNPDNADDHAEITGRWATWFDDHQREAEEVGAKAAIDWWFAEDASPTTGDYDHAAEIMRLREALEQVAKHTHDADTQVRIIAKIAKRALEPS